MSNVSSVYNMTHRNEIRLVWFHTEHVSTHNDTKVTFGGGYNLYRHSHSTCFFSDSEVGILLNYVSIGLYNIYTYQTLTVYHVESLR